MEAAARAAAERMLGEPVGEFVRIARNSNHVFRLTTVSGVRYSLRVPLLRPDRLSPYWQQLQDIFGLRYGTQLGHVGPLAEQICRDGIVTAPRPVAGAPFDGTTAYLFSWIDGTMWEPGEFPDLPDVHEQLGRYLATLHARGHRGTGFGTLEQQPFDAGQLVARANRSMAIVLDRYWADRSDVINLFERRIAPTPPEDLVGSPSPVMPDVSANQFVYRDDGSPAWSTSIPTSSARASSSWRWSSRASPARTTSAGVTRRSCRCPASNRSGPTGGSRS